MENSLAGLLAKGRLKVLAVALREEIASHRLATVLVDALQNFVAGSIAEAGEKGDELAAKGRAGVLLENNLVQFASIGKLYFVDASLE